MREKLNHIYLDSQERTILLHSLVELKKQLIQQGRYTDCVDELIFKVINAPIKKLKVVITGAFQRKDGLGYTGIEAAGVKAELSFRAL